MNIKYISLSKLQGPRCKEKQVMISNLEKVYLLLTILVPHLLLIEWHQIFQMQQKRYKKSENSLKLVKTMPILPNIYLVLSRSCFKESLKTLIRKNSLHMFPRKIWNQGILGDINIKERSADSFKYCSQIVIMQILTISTFVFQ